MTALRACYLALIAVVLGTLPSALVGAQGPPEPARVAQWIWSPPAAGDPDTLYVRQPFNLTEAPTSAVLVFEARRDLSVRLNGIEIVQYRGGSGQRAISVTRSARVGANVLAFQCGPSSGEAGLAFRMALQFAAGRSTDVVSNGNERIAMISAVRWDRADFDDRAWLGSVVIGAWKQLLTSPGQSPSATVPSPGPRATPSVPAASGFGVGRTQSTVRGAQPAIPSADRWDVGRFIRYWQTAGLKAADNAAGRRPRPGDRITLMVRDPAPADLTAATSVGVTAAVVDSRVVGTARDGSILAAGLRPGVVMDLSSAVVQLGGEARCLAHGKVAAAPSLWSPGLGDALDSAVRAALGGAHSPAVVLVELGGRGWGHECLWCGDTIAGGAFRAAMLQKYGTVEATSRAWGVKLSTAEGIVPPAGPGGISRAHWLDLCEWYEAGVAHYMASACEAARAASPGARVLVSVPLDGAPWSVAGLSRLIEAAGNHEATPLLRLPDASPLSSDMARFFRAASAARRLARGLAVDVSGVDPARRQQALFAAVSVGADTVLDSGRGVDLGREAYYHAARYLRCDPPVRSTALFVPEASRRLMPVLPAPRPYEQGAANLRDVMDFDVLSERDVLAGGLDGVRLLTLWEGPVAEGPALDRIRAWVQAGGMIVAYDFGKLTPVDGDMGWWRAVFPQAARMRAFAGAVPAADDAAFGESERVRSEWSHRVGSGWSVFVPVQRANLGFYAEVVRYLTYHGSELDHGGADAPAVDNARDGVVSTLQADRAVFLNTSVAPVRRSVVLGAGALGRGRPGQTLTMNAEPQEAVQVLLGPAAPEMLLQCEAFTAPGAARAAEGAGFSPGKGRTHLLVQAGAKVETRFQCDVTGVYRVFYRVTRRGLRAAARIAIDGKPLDERTAEDAPWGAVTLPAGAVRLTAGVHSLSLSARPGEDLRADFVILASDPSIGGYGFALRPASR